MRDVGVDVQNQLLDFLRAQTQGSHAALNVQVS